MPIQITPDALAKQAATRARKAARQREWCEKNPERWQEIAAAARKRWKERNPEQHLEVQRVNRHRMRLSILELLGGCHCVRCGFSDWRALQIDHVDGGGFADGRTKQNIQWFKRWITANLDQARKEYQVLCANCNWIKRHENDEGKNGEAGWAAYWQKHREANSVIQTDLLELTP